MRSNPIKTLVAASLRLAVWVLLAALLASCGQGDPAGPTTGSVEGVVYDADTSQPIAGITVFVDNLWPACGSDDNGEYRLDNLDRGSTLLQACELQGPYEYFFYAERVNIPAGGVLTHDIYMEPWHSVIGVASSEVAN